MLLKLNATFVTSAAALMLAGTPLSAQITGGIRNAPPIDNAQLVAQAKAEFPSLLAKALSPDGIKDMLARIQNMPITNTSGVTNFDNVSAPCVFDATSALRGQEQYAGFDAPGANGGAILNGCSDFGVDPLSPPNFLAFNNGAFYTPDGLPELPELIIVGHSKSSVSLAIAGGTYSGYPVAVVALGPGGVLGVVITTTTTDWLTQTIAATDITAIALVGNPQQLLVDNIAVE